MRGADQLGLLHRQCRAAAADGTIRGWVGMNSDLERVGAKTVPRTVRR